VTEARRKDRADSTSSGILPLHAKWSIPPSVTPTRRIGRYALHAEIAAGGLATIHIGRLLGPVGFARTVAIKRLHAPFAKDPEFVAGFLDEARLAARIRHPNVVPTLDVIATEGEIFVVMEFVLGESLAELMRLGHQEGEQVPVPIAAAIMAGVLHGLHAAHEARDERGDPLKIVHRDVSPHNILVGADGAPHLIDFGIAKARGRAQVTRDGHIKGKLSYMPPEQLLGATIDQRADVFAASIVLWETLTGRRLFQGVDDGDVVARVLHGSVEPPSTYAPALGRTMDSVVLRGLARDQAKRYSTAREMALAIEAATPLAPPSRVGSWVEALAHEALAERTRQVADVERQASLGDAIERGPRSGPSAPSAAGPTVGVSKSGTGGLAAFVRGSFAATASGARRRVLSIVAGLAIAVVTIAVASAMRSRGRGGAIADLAPPIATAAETLPVIAAPLSSAVPAASSAHGTSELRPARGHRSSQQVPTLPSHPAPAGAPNASCNPPFWYDAEGNKRYHRQCASL
jgi:serine/threonine-protein kinase